MPALVAVVDATGAEGRTAGVAVVVAVPGLAEALLLALAGLFTAAADASDMVAGMLAVAADAPDTLAGLLAVAGLLALAALAVAADGPKPAAVAGVSPRAPALAVTFPEAGVAVTPI